MTKKSVMIGVVGASKATQRGVEDAYRVGRLIAEAGAVLVCGGLGGVMEAASRGCAEAGGEVVGILPGPSSEEANRFVTIPVATNMGHARNIVIAHTADALIAVEGEFGTLSEMAIALKLGKFVASLHGHVLTGVIPVETPDEAVGMALNAVGVV